jgi:hypothetical protein
MPIRSIRVVTCPAAHMDALALQLIAQHARA